VVKIVSVMPCQGASWISENSAALMDVSCTELVPLVVIGISSYTGSRRTCEQTKNLQTVMNLSTRWNYSGFFQVR
jgi:hypothetical protein